MSKVPKIFLLVLCDILLMELEFVGSLAKILIQLFGCKSNSSISLEKILNFLVEEERLQFINLPVKILAFLITFFQKSALTY